MPRSIALLAWLCASAASGADLVVHRASISLDPTCDCTTVQVHNRGREAVFLQVEGQYLARVEDGQEARSLQVQTSKVLVDASHFLRGSPMRERSHGEPRLEVHPSRVTVPPGATQWFTLAQRRASPDEPASWHAIVLRQVPQPPAEEPTQVNSRMQWLVTTRFPVHVPRGSSAVRRIGDSRHAPATVTP